MSAPLKVAVRPAQTNLCFSSRSVKGGAACTLTALAATALVLGVLLYLRTRSEALRSVGSISTMRQVSAGFLTGIGGLTFSLAMIWILSQAVKITLCKSPALQQPKKPVVEKEEAAELSESKKLEGDNNADASSAATKTAAEQPKDGQLAVAFSYEYDKTGWKNEGPATSGSITYGVDSTIGDFESCMIRAIGRGPSVLQITCNDSKGIQKILDFTKPAKDLKVRAYFNEQGVFEPLTFKIKDKSLIQNVSK